MHLIKKMSVTLSLTLHCRIPLTYRAKGHCYCPNHPYRPYHCIHCGVSCYYIKYLYIVLQLCLFAFLAFAAAAPAPAPAPGAIIGAPLVTSYSAPIVSAPLAYSAYSLPTYSAYSAYPALPYAYKSYAAYVA